MYFSGVNGHADAKPRRTAHVIVCGNEKGGSGKSTTAMHIAVALLKSGYSVATVDLDGRQLSLTRYVENRKRWARTARLQLEVPRHFPVPPANRDTVADTESEEFRQLTEGLGEIEDNHDFVVIDTPGS
ncbi:MAG: AAA family ATPase, partial [Phenylobacterium sp.]|nr:AAA family ATPase [Phenylobacterium sp.]